MSPILHVSFEPSEHRNGRYLLLSSETPFLHDGITDCSITGVSQDAFGQFW